MQVPPEIILRGVESTPFIEKAIDRGLAKLEQVCDYIISVRLTVEKAQGRRQTGNPYRMRIDIRIPDRPDIVVNRKSKASKKTPPALVEPAAHLPEEEPETESTRPVERAPVPRKKIPEEPPQALIRRTFDSARRELEKVVEKQRGEVKTPAQLQTQAVVEKLFREQQYGFLRGLDGQQVYFHRNSVLHGNWERLAPGTLVRYTPQMGEKGLQASSVEPVDKPGAAEVHDRLHDLPALS